MYDYLFFDTATGASPYPRPVPTVQPLLKTALANTSATLLGVFAPQLGWSSTQAAVLLAWPSGDAGRAGALKKLTGAQPMKSVQHAALTATARPASDASPPRAGGIYVHRWFVIEAGAVDEFTALSTQGWVDFEQRFEANIFGLFATARSREDQRDGVVRLLLLTRYASHGVWEQSRDPTTDAMKAFARRQALTRVTWASSSLLVEG